MRPAGGTRRRWEWWHRQTPATRQTVRGLLAFLLTGLLAVAVGVTTASTHSSLGPHKADYHVTLDRQISLQMGPLGAVIIDSPLPWPLGAEVVVREIPTDLQTAGSPLPGLLADLEAYGQLFGQPEAAVADAVRGLVTDALGRTAVAWSLLLVLLAAGRLASHGRLRDELRGALARPGVAVLTGAVVLGGTAALVVPQTRQATPAGYSPAVLAGTPLEGARITGRLADVVAVYGQTVRSAFEENEAFYALASENLVAAHEAEGAAPRGRSRQSPAGEGTTADASPSDGSTADGTTSDGTTSDGVITEAPPSDGTTTDGTTTEAEPSAPATTEEEPEPDPVTLLMVSDLHCNVGMASVIATAIEQTGAQVLLDAGDTVMSGTSVESYCVNAFARAVPDGVPVVVATGNHDSVITAEQERQAGWTVLGGDVVEVAGVRILGDTDPTLTAVGSGTRQERDETLPEMEQRLAQVACAAAESGDPVDILLVHNPRAGTATLDAGCAPLQLSGHWHRTVGPEVAGAGTRYISTSSGGGAGGGATVGPLTGEAELTVLRVDRATGEPMDYRRIQVGTDASVRLGSWYEFPRPPSDGGAGTENGGVPDGGDPGNGAVPGGAAPDGAVPDGAAPDGATPDGGVTDGGVTDGGSSGESGD
ncbi:metallophosphoesterase [Georgenia sp. EYE_87]|uniref:metallophosphoesterase family protein n=1 Tax=Georgenia sp. EYE_87 TaxID=2853448 RepID=UPI002002ADEC|nr:metallophosphoesterase [Georgenia sp. EYE_87]MCK6209494.1 metallophosphoesterase [Georgenia sp. EYE_87]